jgi:hypothetical protein
LYSKAHAEEFLDPIQAIKEEGMRPTSFIIASAHEGQEFIDVKNSIAVSVRFMEVGSDLH